MQSHIVTVIQLLQNFWLAILGILAVVGVLCVFSGSPIKLRDVTTHRYHLFHGKGAFYLLMAVILVMNILIHNLAVPLAGEASISLNYDGASQGLNPNDTRFNQADMLSDAILERVIRIGRMEGVSVSDLKDAIEVIPKSNNADSDEYWVSTEYTVKYHANEKLADRDAEEVLDLFCGCYREWFIDQYSYNIQSLETDFSAIENEDYLDMCDFFDKVADHIAAYMDSLADKEATFEMSETGDTFQSIKARANNAKSSLITNLRAYVMDNGIAKDATTFMGRLSADNVFETFDARKYSRSNENRLSAIRKYADDVARIVLVPTYDMDGQFYMSQTKIGIDNFAEDAEDYAKQKTKSDSSIANNQYIYGQLTKSAATAETLAKAEILAAAIEKELTDVSEDAKAAVKEYDNKQANGYLTLSVDTRDDHILEAAKDVVKETVILFAMGLVVSCIVELRKAKKSEAKAK